MIMTTNKPSRKPANSNLSSGPCAKRPGWNINLLKNSPVGRSHRSPEGKEKLKNIIEKFYMSKKRLTRWLFTSIVPTINIEE